MVPRLGLIFSIIVIGMGAAVPLCRAGVSTENPILVNEISIDPTNPQIVYAAARPQGILKSVDRGATWHPARVGLTNTSTYEIVIDPRRPNILYLGTFGGGVFKSEDSGGRWHEINQGLGNTNIHALWINPVEPDQLLVSTSTGDLFQSVKGGDIWSPFSKGLPQFEGDIMATFLFGPYGSRDIYLAQTRFYRHAGPPSMGWRPIGGNLPEGDPITTAEFHPSGRFLYAGTMKHGLLRTEVPDPKVPDEMALHWQPVAAPFQTGWIRLIVFDPQSPSVMYVGVQGGGLYRSENDGRSWQEINMGLPNLDVECLAIDPKDTKHLYVGMHDSGLYISGDAGATWSEPSRFDVESLPALIASLSSQPRSTPPPKEPVAVPAAFAKCNKCHGWTDPVLNQKSTYWRVSPNRRDWQPTVSRMSRGAGLTSAEQKEVVRFLTDYTQRN